MRTHLGGGKGSIEYLMRRIGVRLLVGDDGKVDGDPGVSDRGVEEIVGDRSLEALEG